MKKQEELQQQIMNLDADLTYTRADLASAKQSLADAKEVINRKDINLMKLQTELCNANFIISELEKKIEKMYRNSMLNQLSTIVSCKDMIAYAGKDSATHREKKHHTNRAIQILDDIYRKLREEFDGEAYKYSDVNNLPF